MKAHVKFGRHTADSWVDWGGRSGYRRAGESSGRLSSCGEEVWGSPGGHCSCPPMQPASDDLCDTPPPAHSHPHTFTWPYILPIHPPLACSELQIHKHRMGRNPKGLYAPSMDQCRLGIPTYHPEVPERNQIVTVRNMTELSKADKISPVNCETEVTVLFVLRE